MIDSPFALITKCADQRYRQESCLKLAQLMRASAFLVFLKDDETGSFRPAPGFPQNLPGGPSWRNFLAKAATLRKFDCEVAYPDLNTFAFADARSDFRAVLAFVGRSPSVQWDEIEAAWPLLIELLNLEAKLQTSQARERAAVESARHATHLAQALDSARGDVSKAAHKLQDLNATLEARVAEEVARRTEAEAALRQAQKLEAIGQLTGGVAHDFNNLLTVIMGGLDTIGRQFAQMGHSPQSARLLRAQDMAQQAAKRAATLTARLLAFSRRQPLDPKAIDIDRLVGGMNEILRSTLGEQVKLEIIGNAGLWRATADAPELEHALLNLAVNARDAMPVGGKLTIETGNIWLDDTYVAALAEPVPAGQYVLIAVSDTGIGMDRKTLDRVFEPFFTTKEVGKGTGLGLSQVYGFIRQTGGHIRVYSELGHGTTVKLYLPRATGDEAALPSLSKTPIFLGGNETILVVEDHDDLRAYSAGVLRDLGYEVIEAANGASALSALELRSEVHLLFTDVVLPEGLNGRNIAEAAKRLRPDIKVLFTTGYTRNAIIHNGRLDQGVDLLSKPFTFQSLAEKVREILDRS